MGFLDETGRDRKNAAIESHLALLTEPARILCSFPRSGSYWLRSMLYDYNTLSFEQRFSPTRPFYLKLLAKLAGGKLSSARPTHLGYFSPQIELPSFAKYFLAGRSEQRIVKTHLPIRAWEQYADNKKILLLFRNPADCIVSAYKKRSSMDHRQNTTGDVNAEKSIHLEKLTSLGIDEFALRQLVPWIRHTSSFLEYHQRSPGNIRFVSYERLKSNCEQCLTEILEFYGQRPQPGHVSAVIQNRDISRVKRKLSSARENINVNSGRIGDASNLLAPETLENIESRTTPLRVQLQQLDR